MAPAKKHLFRSLVSIQGPEGYGPSTLPLRHSEVRGGYSGGNWLFSKLYNSVKNKFAAAVRAMLFEA